MSHFNKQNVSKQSSTHTLQDANQTFLTSLHTEHMLTYGETCFNNLQGSNCDNGIILTGNEISIIIRLLFSNLIHATFLRIRYFKI